jgi:hypothetical protein
MKAFEGSFVVFIHDFKTPLNSLGITKISQALGGPSKVLIFCGSRDILLFLLFFYLLRLRYNFKFTFTEFV